MNLTRYSDYSLRVLLYLGVREGEKSSIQEIADFYEISKDHLVKVVHNLIKLGYIKSIRGRNGGIMLAKKPDAVNLGKVVRQTEPNFHIVECFDPKTNHCKVTPVCELQHILGDALKSFFNVLDQYTLGDLLKNPEHAVRLVQIGA